MVHREILCWVAIFGVITAGSFAVGILSTALSFTPKIVLPPYGEEASRVVVFKTSNRYCLERFEEIDGILVVDKTHQEWIESNDTEIEIRKEMEVRFEG